MKITKPSDAPRVWRGRCRQCNAEAEATTSEMTCIDSDWREDGRFSWEKCPSCGAGDVSMKNWGGMLFHEQRTTPLTPPPTIQEAVARLQGLLAATSEWVVEDGNCPVDAAAIRALRQAAPALLSIAEAAAAALVCVEWQAGEWGMPPVPCVRLSLEKFEAMKTAIAALRP